MNKFRENLTERKYSSNYLTRYQCLILLDHKLVFCTLVILTLKYPQTQRRNENVQKGFGGKRDQGTRATAINPPF